MIIVVDGYNVLKQVFPSHKQMLDRQRQLFINQLSDYKQAKEAVVKEVIIVFDAGPVVHATRHIQGGVVVMFSGQKQSADDWIEQYAQRHRGGDILLISSDRKLGDSCQCYGVKVMAAQEFYEIVCQVLAAEKRYDARGYQDRSELQKYTSERDDVHVENAYDQDSLDWLMEQASGVLPSKDHDDEQKQRRRNAQALSKHEKKILVTLKKLR